MNINSNPPSYAYNSPTLKATTPQTQSQHRFSLDNVDTIESKADKVSISTAAANMSDMMDPPVPVGAMPSWWGEFAVEVKFPSERGTAAVVDDARFSNLSSAEANEYFTLLKYHTDELYKRNGLTDDESTYAALNSRSTNERLHQEFLDGMRNDPRMSELAGKLGIALS